MELGHASGYTITPSDDGFLWFAFGPKGTSHGKELTKELARTIAVRESEKLK